MSDPATIVCMPFTVSPKVSRGWLVPFEAVRVCHTGCALSASVPAEEPAGAYVLVCMPFAVSSKVSRSWLVPFEDVRVCRTGCRVPEAPPESIDVPPPPPLSNEIWPTQFALLEIRSDPPADVGARGRFTQHVLEELLTSTDVPIRVTQVALKELRTLPDRPVHITQCVLSEMRQSNEYPP